MYNSCVQQAATFYLCILLVLVHTHDLKIIPYQLLCINFNDKWLGEIQKLKNWGRSQLIMQ